MIPAQLENEKDISVEADVPQIDWKEITIEKEVGRGNFGVVYKAYSLFFSFSRRSYRNQTVAVKVIDASLPENYTHREQRIQYACDHPNILKLYGITTTSEGKPALVLEYAEKSYFQLIQEGVKLDNEEKKRVILELADALLFIHKRGFIHRDFKVGVLSPLSSKV